MAIRVGLPRGLLYYQYGLLWQSFFECLGCEVVVSPVTTKQTLDCGSCLSDVCLPVKVFIGHVYELKDKVDILCLPQVVSTAKHKYTCPNIIGIADMVKNTVQGLPPLIDIIVDMRLERRKLLEAVICAGRRLGYDALDSVWAWYRAYIKNTKKIVKMLDDSNKLRVALIGRPYIINDSRISLGILDKLAALNCEVLTAEQGASKITGRVNEMGKEIFWSTGDNLAKAALAFMNTEYNVDGIIFMTCFACGPDSLIGEVIGQSALRHGVPYMHLTVDEHTAEAGFITRLEAFIDMLARRKEH